jgi:hypothetical protein
MLEQAFKNIDDILFKKAACATELLSDRNPTTLIIRSLKSV